MRVTPIVCVTKADGWVLVCGDYMEMRNPAIQSEYFPTSSL